MTVLNLLDSLVLKHFGQHPERGRRMKLRTVSIDARTGKKLTAGMKYKPGPFGREGTYKPNEITVDAVVALKYVSKNMWHVDVSSHLREQTEFWLLDLCGPFAVKPKKPRKRRTPAKFKPRQMLIRER